MNIIVWFLPVLAWAFTGSIVLRARRQRPVESLRVLRGTKLWNYAMLLMGGPVLVIVALSLVDAFQDSVEAAVVLFLTFSALALFFVDGCRFGVLISPEGLFQYPDIVRWQDVADIRDIRWSLSMRVGRRGRISIPKLVNHVTNEDVELIRQLAKQQPSIASGASIEDTGAREVPWFEAVLAKILFLLILAAGALGLYLLVHSLLLP